MSPRDVEPDDERVQLRRMAWLRRGVGAMLLVGVLAFLVEGADLPADPVLAPPGEEAEVRSDEGATPVDPAPGALTDGATAAPRTVSTPTRRPLAGFDEVAFRISRPGGASFDGFALLADDPSSRRQGLMEQTDLRGYDAMVFRLERPSTGSFYMRNTRIPLSIAFFDARGRFVSSADMVPCPDEVRRCPSYFAEGPYLHAIEVAAGDLPRMGIGPGAVLSFPSP